MLGDRGRVLTLVIFLQADNVYSTLEVEQQDGG